MFFFFPFFITRPSHIVGCFTWVPASLIEMFQKMGFRLSFLYASSPFSFLAEDTAPSGR